MRKAIWCGVALVTLATLGVYGAARYAVDHPDSFLARATWVVSPVRFHTKMDQGCVAATVDQAQPEDVDVESPRREPREIFEPIVVVPGDQPEPPIGQLLPLPIQPVVILEESEVPVMPFVEDEPDVYMPYAEEDEELPVPAVWAPDFADLLSELGIEIGLQTPSPCGLSPFQCVSGFFGFPGNFLHVTFNSVWNTMPCGVAREPVRASAFDRSVPSIANPATEEEAEQGTEDPDSDAARDYHERNHRMYCPYTGAPCPQVYRNVLPRPAQSTPTQSTPR